MQITQAVVSRTERDYAELLGGLSFVELNKYSVASLSSYAGQCFLARNKRPALFSVQHRRIHAMLKCGLRGGVTMMTR